MGKATIFYFTLTDEQTKDEKLRWFSGAKLKDIPFEHIQPDKNNNWINLVDNDFDSLLPLCDKSVKAGNSKKALFELFFAGVPTNRDGWVYDIDLRNLKNKMKYFSETYNSNIGKKNINTNIKWSRDLKNELKRGNKSIYKDEYIIQGIYRPYFKTWHYTEKILNDVLTQNHYEVFGRNLDNQNNVICIPGVGIDRPYHIIGINSLPHLQITPNGQCLALYRYDKNGKRIDNITDWGLEQFVKNYKDRKINKEDIFHYTYAVLHNPAYRKKYELNLKREFPRIPFYKDFKKWAEWGQALMELHINYEKVKPFALKEHNIEDTAPKGNNEIFRLQEPEVRYGSKPSLKVKLKANKETGTIEVDEAIFLTGVPKAAWEYKLGNRSALEWVLDQYKEKKPTDPTIAEKFNTYRFADYKDKVIDLLKRVCTVSVETMKIVAEMEKEV